MLLRLVFLWELSQLSTDSSLCHWTIFAFVLPFEVISEVFAISEPLWLVGRCCVHCLSVAMVFNLHLYRAHKLRMIASPPSVRVGGRWRVHYSRRLPCDPGENRRMMLGRRVAPILHQGQRATQLVRHALFHFPVNVLRYYFTVYPHEAIGPIRAQCSDGTRNPYRINFIP